ncbi:hypothetical protein ACFWPX_24990 [Nocardia sp. NPDC058518]|uniref:hypothetical protein n=1 Tax=Nocardia sp. NPDC058518 TaxID=3346534 RepID=UPI003651EF9F
MPAQTYKVGPGTLAFGEVGTPNDFSCQFTDIALEPSKDSEDALKVLCGDQIPGDVTYTWVLKGTLVQSLQDTGITLYTLAQAGNTVPFRFSPKSGANGFSGSVVIDPTKIGGEVGKTATADFEFQVVGLPVLVPPPVGP